MAGGPEGPPLCTLATNDQCMNLTYQDLSSERMREWVATSVRAVFRKMMSLEITPVSSSEFRPDAASRIMSGMSFNGGATGMVIVRADEGFVRMMIGRLFGEESTEASFEEITDALSEVTNIITGSLRTALMKEGWSCVLNFPRTGWDHHFKVRTEGRLMEEKFHFQSGIHVIEVTVIYGFAYRKIRL